MKKFFAIILLVLLLLPIMSVNASEVTIEPISGESFSEYTERKLRAEAEALGMTYEEYMEYKFGEDETEEVIQEIEPVEESDKAESIKFIINVVAFLLGFAFSVFAYVFVPIIIRLCKRTAYDKKSASKIALINSIVVGFIFAVLTINLGGQWNPAPAILYYFLNRFILSYKRKEQE